MSPPAAPWRWADRHPSSLAFLWGFAEATVFFIVPDVWLTRVALRDFRSALLACAAATLGALLGGTLLWWAARVNLGFVFRRMDDLPGINLELIRITGEALQQQGASALFTGALSGQPYKLFVAHAAAQDLPWTGFMALSGLARFARFGVTTTLAWLVGRALRVWRRESLLRLHLIFWAAFYAVYFWLMR